MGDFIKVNPWGRSLPYFEVFCNFLVDIKSNELALEFLTRGQLIDIQPIGEYILNGKQSGFDTWLNKLIFTGTPNEGLTKQSGDIRFNGLPVKPISELELGKQHVEFGDDIHNEMALYSTFDLKIKHQGLCMVSLQYLLNPNEVLEKKGPSDSRYEIVGFGNIFEGICSNIEKHCSLGYSKQLLKGLEEKFGEQRELHFLKNVYDMGLIATPDAHFSIEKFEGLTVPDNIAGDLNVPYFLTYEGRTAQDVKVFQSTSPEFDLKFGVSY